MLPTLARHPKPAVTACAIPSQGPVVLAVTEHQLYLDAASSDDPMRQARGKGYVAGLTLEPRSPPDTDAERKARYKASGRQIACVIRDPAALAALDTLSEKHGGVTAAVTAALVSAAADRPVPDF